MKNRTFATLGLLALLATVSAFGQQRMKIDIPFEFSTGSTVMPAGQYTVAQESQSGFTNLACYACKVDVRFQTHQIGSYAARNEPSKLVFNKYGDKYFLSSVWMPGRGVGNALPTSKTESETALRAALAPTSQVVLFARR
jgi:hypothetical protein